MRAREQPSLNERDRERALSVVDGGPKAKKPMRRRRCGSCGYLYEMDELHPDYNEDGRQIGLICDSCI